MYGSISNEIKERKSSQRQKRINVIQYIFPNLYIYKYNNKIMNEICIYIYIIICKF